MPKEEKKAGIMDKGPGDAEYKPQVPKFRGDEGLSDAEKHQPDEDEKTVHYDR